MSCGVMAIGLSSVLAYIQYRKYTSTYRTWKPLSDESNFQFLDKNLEIWRDQDRILNSRKQKPLEHY